MTTPFDKLLVLDLDETLVFAEERPLEREPDACVGQYFVYRRPGAQAFMDWAVAAFAEVAVWTASTLNYAIPVIEALLGGRERLAFVWGRERCTMCRDRETYEFELVKDLKKLKRAGYQPRSIIAVDNTPAKWSRSYGNLVSIVDFEGDPDDRELEHLRAYLGTLGACENVRAVEKRGWRRAYAPPLPRRR